MSNDDIAEILREIAAMPLNKQSDAVMKLVADALGTLPVARIEEVRAEILADLDPRIPVVESTLELIEGHLAIRGMMEDGV
jgi:phosphoserine phosphatase